MYLVLKLSNREYDYLQSTTPPSKVNLWKAFAQNYSLPLDSDVVLAIEGNNSSVIPVGYGKYQMSYSESIESVWDVYGLGNCCKDKNDFIKLCNQYPVVCRTGKIFCMELSDVIITDELSSLPNENLSFVNCNITALFAENDFPYKRRVMHEDDSEINMEEVFIPLYDIPEKTKTETEISVREGQKEFRGCLIKAYEGRCCISGENTDAVLQASHIQDYLSKKSNHVQNGLLLRADLHRLFDSGLLTIDEDYLVHISDSINSPMYRLYDGRKIKLPKDNNKWPSKEAIRWKLGHPIPQGEI